MSSGSDRGMVVDANMPPIVPTDQAPTEGHMPPTSAIAFTQSANALDWAKAFVKRFAGQTVAGQGEVGRVDLGLLTTWFANCMEAAVQDVDTDWHAAALAACTAEADRDLIGVASTDADTGEFVYIRCTPDTAAALVGRLQSTLVEGVS